MEGQNFLLNLLLKLSVCLSDPHTLAKYLGVAHSETQTRYKISENMPTEHPAHNFDSAFSNKKMQNFF